MSRGDDISVRVLDRLLEEEAGKLSLHLPRSRSSLTQLLAEEDPCVESLGGGKIHFRRRDLEEAATIVPEKYRASLMLPIMVIRRMGMGRGVFTVSGGRVEKHLVKRVLGLTDKGFEELAGCEEVYIYRVQIQELLSRLDSLVAVGFGVPEEPL